MTAIPYQQCQICQSVVFEEEERYLIHHPDRGDMLSCVLCAKAAESMGWWISCA